MTGKEQQSSGNTSRREFLHQSSLAVTGAAAAATLSWAKPAYADEEMEIKIGVIGCGGRGTGAALDALGAATRVIYPQSGYHTEDVADGTKVQRKNIRIVALADLFQDRLDRCRGELKKLGIEIDKESCYTGFDGYEKVLGRDDVNYVILATPPHFRPQHLLAAVKAGKHAFIEKPAAVDVPGVKTVMEAGQLAAKKKIGIVAGTQRRHMENYQETIRRIQEGAIGELVFAKSYWNGGQIWVVDREPGWSDLEWQLRNWNYFTWLSGDHYVEQHVHNLDIMNWVLGAHPVRAVSGIGGRQVRIGDRHGHIFDHFAVEYEYPNGVTMFSQARQINNCLNKVEEEVVGTAGRSNCKDRIQPTEGKRWRYREKVSNPYQKEHEDLIASIRAGNPLNEAQTVAESTLTGIMGREAAYSGQEITWEQAMASTTRLGPAKYEFASFAIPPIAMPGVYKFS